MVGNCRKIFIFLFLASQESFAKIKTRKLSSMCKVNEMRFQSVLPSRQENHGKCAFDGWSHPGHWNAT